MSGMNLFDFDFPRMPGWYLRCNLYIKLRRSHDSFDPFKFPGRKKNRRHIHRSPTENYTTRLSFGFVTRLRYADKLIVNIMKVYIERNNLQLD